MTDRMKGCTVVFEPGIREDAAETILGAIRLLRGVQSVSGKIEEGGDFFLRSQLAHNITMKLYKLAEEWQQ